VLEKVRRFSKHIESASRHRCLISQTTHGGAPHPPQKILFGSHLGYLHSNMLERSTLFDNRLYPDTEAPPSSFETQKSKLFVNSERVSGFGIFPRYDGNWHQWRSTPPRGPKSPGACKFLLPDCFRPSVINCYRAHLGSYNTCEGP
jgi:hypothetical protein